MAQLITSPDPLLLQNTVVLSARMYVGELWPVAHTGGGNAEQPRLAAKHVVTK
jgi:hypothetical protein